MYLIILLYTGMAYCEGGIGELLVEITFTSSQEPVNVTQVMASDANPGDSPAIIEYAVVSCEYESSSSYLWWVSKHDSLQTAGGTRKENWAYHCRRKDGGGRLFPIGSKCRN